MVRVRQKQKLLNIVKLSLHQTCSITKSDEKTTCFVPFFTFLDIPGTLNYRYRLTDSISIRSRRRNGQTSNFYKTSYIYRPFSNLCASSFSPCAYQNTLLTKKAKHDRFSVSESLRDQRNYKSRYELACYDTRNIEASSMKNWKRMFFQKIFIIRFTISRTGKPKLITIVAIEGQ